MFFVKINGESHHLWPAVDHCGEALQVIVSKKRGSDEIPCKNNETYNHSKAIATDRFRSDDEKFQVTSGDLNNGMECSPALSTTRASNASISAHAKFTEVRGLLLIRL